MPTNEMTAYEINEFGEVSEREFTAEEIAQQKIDKKVIEEMKKQEIAKAEARESALAKLAALGLTEAEIASL